MNGEFTKEVVVRVCPKCQGSGKLLEDGTPWSPPEDGILGFLTLTLGDRGTKCKECDGVGTFSKEVKPFLETDAVEGEDTFAKVDTNGNERSG